jgi:hypothetical protein
VFRGEAESKVLAVCSEGHRCNISGLLDECEDSGECVEITRVTSVQDLSLTRGRGFGTTGRQSDPGDRLQASSLWSHNGSLMGLMADGPSRRFVYERVREGMARVGVRPGTVLFEGQKDGNQYTGTAYIFPPNCPSVAYDVSGPVSPDDRQVTMFGQAPRVDSRCRIFGYRDDVLVFSYVRTVSGFGR